MPFATFVEFLSVARIFPVREIEDLDDPRLLERRHEELAVGRDGEIVRAAPGLELARQRPRRPDRSRGSRRSCCRRRRSSRRRPTAAPTSASTWLGAICDASCPASARERRPGDRPGAFRHRCGGRLRRPCVIAAMLAPCRLAIGDLGRNRLPCPSRRRSGATPRTCACRSRRAGHPSCSRSTGACRCGSMRLPCGIVQVMTRATSVTVGV